MEQNDKQDISNYCPIENLNVFVLTKELRFFSWNIYKRLNWQDKKICGDQFIMAIDSIGANIAEGYGRFHYLDKNKFYYNARGSLTESKYWIETLFERNYITEEEFNKLKLFLDKILIKLNSLIKSQHNRKNKEL